MYLNKFNVFIHSKKEGMNCMKTTGITRRIDELGRIVIPKEIRKNMHLKTGELLEIFLNDSETIMLKKHSIINKNQEFLNYYVKTLAKKFDCDVYVTNLSEIMFSNRDDVLGEKISTELEDFVSNGTNFNNLDKISVTKFLVLNNIFKIYPLSPNGDLSGLLIVNFKNSKQEADSVIEFSTAFLENYLENN